VGLLDGRQLLGSLDRVALAVGDWLVQDVFP
jgi:hypothetical protein